MYKVYAITDKGLERENNQDGFFVDGVHFEDTDHREIYYETDSDHIHVSLCDGVGSTLYASKAVKKANEYLSSHLDVSDESSIEKMIVDLNAFVYESLQADNMSDAACTIAGIVMKGDTAYIYNVGDSTGFSINNGYLEKQTVDDTGVELFGQQTDSEDGIKIKPPLIQSIGTNRLIDLVHIKREQDDVAFLLCTDGITDMLTLDEMEEILESSNSIKEVAQKYISEANARGGYDNSTVIILINEEE